MKKVITISRADEIYQLGKPGDYRFVLNKEGASVVIGGSFITKKDEVANVYVIIEHAAAHTRANTTLKGVARDQSQIKFVGKIIINEHCPGSNSFLTERILLLSDKARAEAIPELEILTDDVKCSHAASISQIPEEQLFYLSSRGISRGAAEDLIVEGFLG